MKKEIVNVFIVTMNKNMDTIKDGYVVIEENKILQIGTMENFAHDEQAEITDAQGMILMPGLVNAHTHIAMNLLRGYADDLPLDKWLYERIFPAESRLMVPNNVTRAARAAMVEMVRCGTTCFNDMYFFQNIVGQEIERIGLRAVIGESISDYMAPSFATPEDGISRSKALIEHYQGHATIHPSVCAHAPYTCSDMLLRRLSLLSQEKKVPFHIHVAETQQEVRDILSRTGRTPVTHLAHLGVLRKNTVIAHAVWLDENDIRTLASNRVSIAHCPKSNLKLGSGIADTVAYMNAGVNVAIGTDSVASNNTLDIVEEMRFAALLPKVKNPESIPAQTALRMATIQGAKALGLDSLIGSIEKGKRADIILIDSHSYNMTPSYNIFSTLVYSMNSRDVHSSMVNGEWIMKNKNVIKE